MLTRSFLSLALAIFIPASAHAARAVMENIAASNNTVFVDTQTKRVHLSTQAYGGGVPDVSLYTTSNVVVGDGNACVIYATGTARCKSFAGSIDYSTITAALNAKLSSVTINASLFNPEASASLPLGVDSSSVAVKNSSNFVLNSEIDPSSVAKFGSSGSSLTFTATGDSIYSLTTSSGIHVVGGMVQADKGVCFGDNSCINTATSGSGDTTNSGYVAMSGENNWVSGSSITVDSGTSCRGIYCIYASSEPIASTSTAFSLTRTTSCYELEVVGYWNSSGGHPIVRFNNDSGSSYQYALWQSQTNETTNITGSGDTSTHCNFTNNSVELGSNGNFMLNFRFCSYGNSKQMFGHFTLMGRNASGTAWKHSTGMCRYTGSSDVVSVKVEATGGAFRGLVRLWENQF